MKVLHINTFSYGGAANACLRLNKGLRKIGVDSKVLFLNGKEIKRDAVKQINTKVDILKKIGFHLSYRFEQLLLTGRKKGLEMFTFPHSIYDISKTKEYREADIINLHWTAFFLNWPKFFLDNKKIVWTLHDMNAFTGGCHYSFGCNQFTSNCAKCPQLKGTINQGISKYIFETKQKSLSKKIDIISISPSVWLKKMADKSLIFGSFKNLSIANSVDSEIFKPIDRNKIKNNYGIDKNKITLLFVADSVDNIRKGYNILLKSLSKIDDSNIQLVAVGTRPLVIEPGNKIVYLGKIGDEKELCNIYNLADIFIIPSIEDNLPNTVIESLMCGTPVLGFPIGGIVDMVQPKINGWICDSSNSKSLTKTINFAIDNYSKLKRKEIASDAKKKYDLTVQATKYKKVYKEILSEK